MKLLPTSASHNSIKINISVALLTAFNELLFRRKKDVSMKTVKSKEAKYLQHSFIIDKQGANFRASVLSLTYYSQGDPFTIMYTYAILSRVKVQNFQNPELSKTQIHLIFTISSLNSQLPLDRLKIIQRCNCYLLNSEF